MYTDCIINTLSYCMLLLKLFHKNKKIEWRPIVLAWLPLAVVTTVLSGMIGVVVFQNYRQSAETTPAQIIVDVADLIKQGRPLNTFDSQAKADLGTTLSPFLILVDKDGKPAASSVALDGKTPTLPQGVLDYTKAHGEDRVTWQPKAGVRSAIVVSYVDGPTPAFVVGGQPLREIEKHEMLMLYTVLAGWLVAMGGSLVAVGVKKMME